MDEDRIRDLLRRVRDALQTWYDSDAPEAEFELYTETRELIEEIEEVLNRE